MTALEDVHFGADRGQFVSIMGPSGSGKSTLLHLLGGLDRPTAGEVKLAGRRLSDLSDKELTLLRRVHVGFIFQFYNLLPTLSVEENIALPLVISGQSKAEYADKIERLLDLVGLSARARHKPDQLSGGEQQRVAIARSFINDPEIVLADEPTGNLDSNTGTATLQLLKRANSEFATTIILVTHDAHAASYADRVVFLKDGRIVHELRRRDEDQDIETFIERILSLEL